jgi:hypothetical protein
MRYQELREYIVEHGDIRVSTHRGLRDKVISWIVEDWPVGHREDELAEVLMHAMAIRLRERYNSVILTFLLYVVVSQLVKLAIEWFLERLENRQLMMQYHAQASGNL